MLQYIRIFFISLPAYVDCCESMYIWHAAQVLHENLEEKEKQIEKKSVGYLALCTQSNSSFFFLLVIVNLYVFQTRTGLSIIFIMKNFLTKLSLMVFFSFTLDGFYQTKIRCLNFSYLPTYLLNISKLSYAYIITQKGKMFIFISLLSFCVQNSYYLCVCIYIYISNGMICQTPYIKMRITTRLTIEIEIRVPMQYFITLYFATSN